MVTDNRPPRSGLQVPEHIADWSQSSQHIGVAHVDQRHTRRVQGQRPAGITTQQAGYTQAANDYPRFERQQVCALYDEGITSGTKVPHQELLRRYPNREIPQNKSFSGSLDRTNLRPETGLSGRSGRSGRSTGSSRRSLAASAAGSAIAGPSASAGPPPGYVRQARTPTTLYTTSNNLYGAGGHVGAEPCPGREVLNSFRGGGQVASFDNCLVEKGRVFPLSCH
eukprot:TRINITY_DN35623_c0_g1_i1.p1 TRINITY_DN35623_c0_g1~~TRINITY_DN35623_c0_g1_i1.p1  ORF type:complete len:245 (+),score=22.33 TRINITY_DN35623_c0_g1_i1:65-736(+)